MRKPEVAAYIAEETDMNLERANEVLSIILDEITNAMSRNETITLIGFGTFEVRKRNARKGINPQTGKTIDIAASNSVGFKPGKALKDALK